MRLNLSLIGTQIKPQISFLSRHIRELDFLPESFILFDQLDFELENCRDE